MGLHNGSLALYGNGNINNGMVVLFPSRDAKPDDVDNVGLHLECSHSGVTNSSHCTGWYMLWMLSLGTHSTREVLHGKRDNVPIVGTLFYLQQCSDSCVVDLCKSLLSIIFHWSLLTSLIFSG